MCKFDCGFWHLYGLNPLTHEYKLLAIASIDLINGLKSKTGSPTVCIPLTNDSDI